MGSPSPASLLLLSLLSLFSLLASAADPPPGITTIYVKVYFIQINKLDGVEQSFNADFYMTTIWFDNRTDPNLGYQPGVDWDPAIEFANSRGSVERQIDDPFYLADPDPAVLELDSLPPGSEGHWVACDQRYIGDFTTPLRLGDFPFDTQDVVLKIESALYDEGTVNFSPAFNLSNNLLPDEFEIIEWTLIKDPTVQLTSHYYPSFDQTYHQMEVRLFLKRQSEYYIWKIFLGSILLVIMNIAIFALGVSEPDRMMGTITVFLALVAFLFVAQDAIPKVAYQTRLDQFMSFSFFMVFFSLVAHSVIYLLKSTLPERIQKPHKFNSDGTRKGSPEASHDKLEVEDLAEREYGFSLLPLPRKADFFFVVLFSVSYTVGVAVILGA